MDAEGSDGYFDVFYTCNRGEGWAAPENVTAGSVLPEMQPIYSVMPALAVDGKGRVHVAYMRDKGQGQNLPEDRDIWYFGSLGPPQAGVYLPIILKNS